jgi:hypothetical protein
MARKTVSIYNSSFDLSSLDTQQLNIEVSSKHVSCVLKSDSKKRVDAFELFELDIMNGSDFEDAFYEIRTQSRLLDKSYKQVNVYYNLHEAVLVPAYKFNTNIAAEFISLSFGDKQQVRIHYETVNVEPNIINVYRLNEQWRDVINRNFISISEKHIYSELIEQAAEIETEAVHFIQLHFYKAEMIIVAMAKKQLQLIQKFAYSNAADALYHLLNTCKQLGFPVELTEIRLSGMVELNSETYQQIEKYFHKLMVEEITRDMLTKEQLSEYPQHFFTPYFKLGV